ncbi:LysR family transcriptional regulator [Ruminococcus gauvreauii]|uniref:LysR family transcriptional regulator n=1 Tax=Ruminococcus gauvreauii TaxID=438033 RepID=A0ABY5VFJ7_9FIRM|nr:LysR family transcriptional regulator [Ruminococcus gauvreauii]UWP59320.1 LysR family transcriptional regulator [Ruminococcus gauvreauii]
MDQNLSLYRIFYTVANTQNISKAASELFISQPAISKSLRKLEENLNLSLFIRNSRGVTLTSEGKTLYTYVSQAFDALQTGEEKLRQIQELGIGHIRIGVSSTLCKFTLLPYLEDFIKTHPHIRITIECQSTSHTLSLLRENKIDLGLIGRPESLLHLHFDSLGEIEDIFVATGTYLSNLTLRSADGNADIFKNATLMLLDKGNITRQYIDDYLVLNHIETGNVLEISTMDLLIEFAKISLGVACVIKQFVQNELSSGELLEIPLEYPIRKREIGFAYPRQAGQSGAVQKFIDFCLRDKP